MYEQLVFGETYGPDGSILTPPASTAKPEKAQKGPGFGSMSSWQGPGQGQGQGPGQGLGSRSKSNSNSSMKTNSGTEIKDTAVLTDLPRKVCEIRQFIITPLSYLLTLLYPTGSVDGTNNHPPDAGKFRDSNARHFGTQ